MPLLHGGGIAVRLASPPLRPSLTAKIELKKGPRGAVLYKAAEKPLKDSVSTPLQEEPVPFPGDSRNFSTNWLGDVLFQQVVVGRPSERSQQLATLRKRAAAKSQHAATNNAFLGHVFSTRDAGQDENTSLRVGPGYAYGPSPYQGLNHHSTESKALAVHVHLSDKTFRYPSEKKAKHLKIEVFFNGQLTNCERVQKDDIRTGDKTMHRIFAGTRIDFQAERPWIMLAPGETTNSQTAWDRWMEICEALEQEANERGVDAQGARPPTATYLHDLANMQMPDCVHEMQAPYGRKFGVIDVIVTIGTGNKLTKESYLKVPTRYRDDRYSREQVEGRNGSEFLETNRAATGRESGSVDADEQEFSGGDLDADGDSDPEYIGSLASSSMQLPSQQRPNPPPDSSINWHDPFAGPSMLPSQPLQVGALQEVEPPKKRSRIENAAPVAQGYPDIGASQHYSIQQPSYPSTHAPSFRSSGPYTSYRPSMPHGEYHVNQYDSFQHADPYQRPYAGMMVGLDYTSPDGLPSPFQHPSGGQLTLPRFMATPEIVPSTSANSSFGSSPYAQTMELPGQDLGVPIAPAGPIPPNVLVSSAAPPIDTGIPGTGGFPYTGAATSSSPFARAGTASFRPRQSIQPYVLPPSKPSTGPPPGIGYFEVYPPPNPALYIEQSGLENDKCEEVNVNHQSKNPGCAHATAVLEKNASLKRAPVAGALTESATEPRRQSTRSARVLATPPVTSPNMPVSSGQIASAGEGKRDSIIDGPLSAELQRSAEIVPASATKAPGDASAPPRASSRSYDTVPPCNTASTSILDIQGPSAIPVISSNPTLQKSKRKLQSRSVSPTKVDASSSERAAESVEPRMVNEAITPAAVNSGSSSPLSELSKTPSHTSEDANGMSALSAPLTSASVSTAAANAAAHPSVPTNLTKKHIETPRKGKYVKEPRSPGRLDAKDNPPLNKDCVIQYAISQREPGALRQVKGERKGEFKEDRVVVGCRFFVPGY